MEKLDFFDDDAPDVLPEQALDLPAPEPDVPARSAKPRRHPGDPTKAEMDAHNLTHCNYRSWCSICNRVALVQTKTKAECQDWVPCISFDYKTMGESASEEDKITSA